MESGKDHCPELLEEGVVLVGVKEFVEIDVNAGEAGSDAGCFPPQRALYWKESINLLIFVRVIEMMVLLK